MQWRDGPFSPSSWQHCDSGTDCTAIADARSGRTVSEEIADIEVAKRNDRDQVSAAIQGSVDNFILHSVRTSDQNFDGKSVANDLRQILSSMAPVQGATDQLPTTFVLHSRRSSALLVLYQVQDETMGQDSPWTVLNAYDKVGASLRHSDSTGRDMDGYAGLEVKELYSPVPDEIWLLVSGHLTGANGPKIRMRVFAFDGTKFRTVWMPANVWGSFTTRVTPHGFTVDGEYYRPNLQRHDVYYLAPDGHYVDPPTSQ
jgi:hypothetical protein